MLKRTLFVTFIALFILQLPMQAQQKKHTYYVLWIAYKTSPRVIFTSRHIIKVETDSVWLKDNELTWKAKQMRGLNFRYALQNIVSDNDFKAIGSYDDIATLFIDEAKINNFTDLGYDPARSIVDNVFGIMYEEFMSMKESNCLIFSVDYRYNPRGDERVTYLNPPMSPTACRAYTKDILTKMDAEIKKSGSLQGKFTYYLFLWHEFLVEAKVLLINQSITKIESDSKWDRNSVTGLGFDYRGVMRGSLSEDDLQAVGDSVIEHGAHYGLYTADYYTLDDVIRDRNVILRNVLKKFDDAVIYSIDYRYKPWQGETVTHLNPISLSDYPLYTKGIIAKKLRH